MNEEIDLLFKARRTISRMKLSMLAHPDCTEGSEFDDFTTKAEEVQDQITDYLETLTE